MEEDDTEERHEGDDTEHQEDTEIINWMENGGYGGIDPATQYDYDDAVDRLSHRDDAPWDNVMTRWRHRLIAAWRLIKHWLVSWI